MLSVFPAFGYEETAFPSPGCMIPKDSEVLIE